MKYIVIILLVVGLVPIGYFLVMLFDYLMHKCIPGGPP